MIELNPSSAPYLVQLTGRELKPGQIVFPERTPADPFVFVDGRKGPAYIYGTQVEGRGISFLRYPNLRALLHGETYELCQRDVYLENGTLLVGREAIWDTYRLAYRMLERAFPRVSDLYEQLGLKPGSDLFYGGVALKADGTLGAFPDDNWRRRIHAMAELKDGRLQLLNQPVFNRIPIEAQTSDYPGFGRLAGLPGNYLGHAYGPNFKLVPSAVPGEAPTLWMIHEEIDRRTRIRGKEVELTEIFARRMLDPFTASAEKVKLLSVENSRGRLAPDSCRGPLLSYTKLLEGFRPTSVDASGVRISYRVEKNPRGKTEYVFDPELAKQEYFFLTGSCGNFCGDDYDVMMAVRKGDAIGPYQMLKSTRGARWKRFLRDIKAAYELSWAGRGCFIEDEDGQWWLLFHAVHKALHPEGSYTGIIPARTEEYHRNIYAVPLRFVLGPRGEPDIVFLRNESGPPTAGIFH